MYPFYYPFARIAPSLYPALIMFLLAGCSGSRHTVDRDAVVEVPALQVEVLNRTSHEVSFSFVGQIPTPCYSYHNFRVNRVREKTIEVTVSARRWDGSCVQAVSTLSIEALVIPVPRRGDYEFRFAGVHDPIRIDVTID